jgi:mycoredoxin
MITVYGADWCEDTRRSLRHLRRLHVPHRYLNIDEDLDALQEAKALNDGRRRTPTIDLGIGGRALVEPDNDTLTGALVELEMLAQEDARERLAVQNVGDVERIARTVAGGALIALAAAGRRETRWPLAIAGVLVAASGAIGWCPIYHATGVTSLGGPVDRPDEAERRAWLVARSHAVGDAPLREAVRP